MVAFSKSQNVVIWRYDVINGVKMTILSEKTATNRHLGVICDVITPDEVIRGVLKCFYCVAGKISYGIGYGLHIIYVLKVVKMSEIGDNQ